MSYILKSQFVTSSLVSQNAIPGKGITMKELVQQQFIEQRIFIIRGHKVMLDKDLAQLYGVKTKVLNQATKRNIDRFPEDFMFKLTKKEVKDIKEGKKEDEGTEKKEVTKKEENKASKH